MTDSTAVYELITEQGKLQRSWRYSLPNYPLPCYRDDGVYVVEEAVEVIDVLMRDNPAHARNNDKEASEARKKEELGDVGRMIFDMFLANESGGLPIVDENPAHAKTIDALLNLINATIDARRVTDSHQRKILLTHIVHRWVNLVNAMNYDPRRLLNDARAKQTRKHAQ